MHFKTVKLTIICNGPKRTISTSNGSGLLQMISKLDTEQYITSKIGQYLLVVGMSYYKWY